MRSANWNQMARLTSSDLSALRYRLHDDSASHLPFIITSCSSVFCSHSKVAPPCRSECKQYQYLDRRKWWRAVWKQESNSAYDNSKSDDADIGLEVTNRRRRLRRVLAEKVMHWVFAVLAFLTMQPARLQMKSERRASFGKQMSDICTWQI